MAKPKIKWKAAPDPHDYPAAESYLMLHFTQSQAISCVSSLKLVPMSEFKAKDIFRASGLSLLGVSNFHVRKDRQKIKKGIELSPLLLIRDGGKIIVADGYHRLCAIYEFDEDAIVPVKIA